MSLPTTTYEITVGDDYSLYDGGGVREAEETNLPVSLDGRGFVVDMSDDLGYYHRYQRTSVNLTNTQQANNGGDQAQVPPEVFRRVTETWDFGVGQDRYDRDQSLPGRYRDSYRVDVWDAWKIQLLPDVAQLLVLDVGRIFLETVNNQYLVAAIGTSVYWWTDLTLAPTVSTLANPVSAMTTDGQNLYVLDNVGVVTKFVNAATSSTFATISGYFSARPLLAYVKGFLISAAANVLVDISDGTQATIYTHPMTDFWWRAACDGLNAAYLVGGMGDKWSILAMNIKSDATTFDPPTVAAPLPDGQIPYTIASYLGNLLVGMDDGWIFGSTDTSGKITYGRMVLTHTPVRCFEGQDRFVWYGMNGDPALTTAGLGRADLSTFPNDLTPAYAPDLSSPVVTGDVDGVVTFSDRRVFAVNGSGIWLETVSLAPTGWLRQGDVSFNTSDNKQGLYADIHHEPLKGSVQVDVSYDGGAFGLVGTNTNGQSVSMGHLNLTNSFTRLELRYDLARDTTDVTSGPVVTRSEIRAIPVSGRATEWRLPIQLQTSIGWDDNTQMRNIDQDYDLLMDLFTTKRPVKFREAGRLYTVYATDFLFLGERYVNNGQSIAGKFLIILREVI